MLVLEDSARVLQGIGIMIRSELSLVDVNAPSGRKILFPRLINNCDSTRDSRVRNCGRASGVGPLPDSASATSVSGISARHPDTFNLSCGPAGPSSSNRTL